VSVAEPLFRVGEIKWSAEYGVRECWLVHQDEKRVGIITFDARRISKRRLIAARDAIVSGVLPDFSLSLDEIIDL
jgi:hypothetical protein